MTAVFVQAGASLVIVLLVAWLVGKLGLGADPRIENEAHAIRLAEEAEAGFRGVEVASEREGLAAIVRNAGGRMMLVRANGNHFPAPAVARSAERRGGEGCVSTG